MSLLLLNGSPKTDGIVASLLKVVGDAAGRNHSLDWVDVYDLSIQPCIGCMACRPDGCCMLPEDDGHRIAERIRTANGLIVGTPTHWGNMSAPLKNLFDRVVPALIGETPRGLPFPRHRGKPAAILTACAAPWPFNVLAAESRGAIRSVAHILGYGGYDLIGTLARPGTRSKPEITPKDRRRGEALGLKISGRLAKAP